ncbi:MAG: hypothetical protein RLZZ272_31 [Actinomycetota bacterium]
MPDANERSFPSERFDDVLRGNAAFADASAPLPPTGEPRRRLAVVTCIDARIDTLAVLGLDPGDAVVIRNPGARITDETHRTLAIAEHVLGVERVLVLPHTDCRMAKSDEAALHAAIEDRTGIDTTDLVFGAIPDQLEALRADLELLRSSPLVAGGLVAGGAMLDVASGLLRPLDL